MNQENLKESHTNIISKLYLIQLNKDKRKLK